ncbi:MAG: 50S ribosome-binding GTPase [Planctomycetes bacterium]|nr:50S ribosome-binding GTPase [Planctomycetota bacterium]
MTDRPGATETIAAVATPPGEGGRGVIRLSGPRAIAIAARVFRPAPGEAALDAARGSSVLRGAVGWADGAPPAPARALLLRAPRSYTREDSVELHLTGSPPVLAGVLRMVLAGGARPAGPGEFTRRAFENGRIDLIQAEAVERLIAAAGAAELSAAREALAGDLGDRIRRIADTLRTVLARVEAGLDFSEDDGVAGSAPRAVRRVLARCARALSDLARAPAVERLDAAATIALAGPPNAGKSTLFNRLAGLERSIVSPEPGTTRDPVRARVVWHGRDVDLVDLAGLGAPRSAVDRAAGERAREEIGRAASILWLVPVDASDPAQAIARAIAAMGGEGAERLLVWSKSDLAPAPGIPAGIDALPASGRTGEGVPEIIRWIEAHVIARRPEGAGVAAASAREAEALAGAARILEGVSEAEAEGEEILALEIRAALARLEAAAGRTAPDEILDRIFSRFCVGK